MKLRAAVSATKALWDKGQNKWLHHRQQHQDPATSTGYAEGNKPPHHKDSDGATTATTAKSSTCGTTDDRNPGPAGGGVGRSASTASRSLIKLAKAVSRLGPSFKEDDAGRLSAAAEVRSVSSNSLSTGCKTGPLQRGEPLRRQLTGPFQLHDDAERSYVDDETHGEGEEDADEAGLRRIRGHPFEMTEEDKRVILSCLAHQQRSRSSLLRTLSSGSSHHTPQYRVEICAKGPEDDDTLDGIMTEKLREEARAEAEAAASATAATASASASKSPVAAVAAAAAGLLLLRARSGGSKSSSGGILASLRRSSGSVVSSLSGHRVPSSVGRASSRGHGGGDDADTLDEFMAREDVKEEDRRRRLRRVGSGILESLDRLRRTHSTLLDRNDLWLKRALEAIEVAKLARHAPKKQQQPRPRRSASGRLSSHPRDIVVKRHASSNTQDSPLSSMLHNVADGVQDEPSTPPLIEKLQDRVEALLPRCTVTAEPPPAVLVPPFLDAPAVEVDLPVSPIPEDDASVALIEVFVHYLTCGHVLREHELKQSPRITCPALSKAMCADSPMMIPDLDEPHGRRGAIHLHRRRELRRHRGIGFCSSADCVADDDEDEDDDEEDYDDEDRTYQSDYDDGTLEGSFRQLRSKEFRSSMNPDVARSSTETTFEEKKEGK